MKGVEPVSPVSSDAKAASRASHPPALVVLYLTEVWERFSFYGMRSLLVLYLNEGVLGAERFGGVHGSSIVVALFGQPKTALEAVAR